MNPHPLERFLGVPSDADPFALLGLTSDYADTLVIDEALRQRLGVIFRHPDGRGPEAEEARAALRAAAEAIKTQIRRQREAGPGAAPPLPAWMSQASRNRPRPREAAAVAFNLTAFDRMVLSVLVACGGWNTQSRAQLVALAQTYGVTVQGLLRVMQGLSEYARAGGPRLGVQEIAGGKPIPPLTPVAAAAPPAVGPALLDRLADNLGHELKHGGAWPTIKLSIIFGVVTLVAAIIAARVLLRPEPSTAKNGAPEAVQPEPTTAAAATTRAASGGDELNATRIARFAKTPTFLGNGLPADAVNAVDHLPALPGQIDELARKITVADGEPSEAVYKQWEADTQTIAMSWVIGDASTRGTIDKAILETLRAAADTPAVSDRLLKTLLPPASVAAPLDVWRGSWMAGTLARIASSPHLPPVVVDRARSQLEITLSQSLRGQTSFESAADLWLRQRLPQLVQSLPFDDKAYDTWELWLSAQRALGTGDRFDEAVAQALLAVLVTEYDISNPGPPVNVVARLLGGALQSRTPMARQRMLDLFDDEQVTSRDLWVVTSLLTLADDAPWFPDRLVVPEDADMPHRWRVRDDLAKAWPMPVVAAGPTETPQRPKLDEKDAARFADLALQALAPLSERGDLSQLQRIIDASRLIEAAAALTANMPEAARNAMQQVEDGWASALPKSTSTSGVITGGGGGGAASSSAKPRAGQSIGTDGVWAAQYAQLGKNTEARTESIRTMQSTAGTDLGPIDAALLVREAYRGSPQEVRAAAQAVVSQQFTSGPVVGMQLLDQFPDAPSIESVSEMIQALTNRLLPGVRSSTWPAEARLALVQHVLALRDFGGSPVDSLMEPLVNSYMNRLALLKKDAGVTSAPSTADEAAALLLRGMLDEAEFAAPSEPTPADLPNIQRRHNTRLTLAEGPMQTFVACQLAILDVTTYLTVAEQPALRDRALEIMREHAAARSRMSGVLDQSRDIELAILEMWRLRFGLDPKDDQQGAST